MRTVIICNRVAGKDGYKGGGGGVEILTFITEESGSLEKSSPWQS